MMQLVVQTQPICFSYKVVRSRKIRGMDTYTMLFSNSKISCNLFALIEYHELLQLGSERVEWSLTIR